jgi:hypothetical protein
VTNYRDNTYIISWINDEFGIDPQDDNVDVIVEFASGEQFTATFFALGNVQSLLDKYNETGECANGLYLWSAHMILITRLTKENVETAVADLLTSGEFAEAFEGPL